MGYPGGTIRLFSGSLLNTFCIPGPGLQIWSLRREVMASRFGDHQPLSGTQNHREDEGLPKDSV